MGMLRNARRELFCQAVAKGRNVPDAYVEAGFKPNRRNSERLRREPEIEERLKELMTPAIQETGATVERVLEEYCHLAFYDVTAALEEVELEGKKGRILICRDPRKLPEGLRRAITEIRPVDLGDGIIGYRIKLASKEKALADLGRHLQMFKDHIVIENVFKVVKDMPDDELYRRLAELERAVTGATTIDPSAGEIKASIH